MNSLEGCHYTFNSVYRFVCSCISSELHCVSSPAIKVESGQVIFLHAAASQNACWYHVTCLEATTMTSYQLITQTTWVEYKQRHFTANCGPTHGSHHRYSHILPLTFLGGWTELNTFPMSELGGWSLTVFAKQTIWQTRPIHAVMCGGEKVCRVWTSPCLFFHFSFSILLPLVITLISPAKAKSLSYFLAQWLTLIPKIECENAVPVTFTHI